MKVRELIEWLSGEDQDLDVHVAYNYGDHWHTTVAPKVQRVEEAAVTFSDYHRMPKVVEEDDEKGDEARGVVLFTSLH
jgi:hypothetical protein